MKILYEFQDPGIQDGNVFVIVENGQIYEVWNATDQHILHSSIHDALQHIREAMEEYKSHPECFSTDAVCVAHEVCRELEKIDDSKIGADGAFGF